ncbi:MAG: hypothetical protein II943_00835 [Victivallales bacterium]|nr:hypothetical protein [Victivallales bacterium]
MLVNKQQFKNALAKASILTSSALTGDKVRFTALGGQASITASNGAGMGIFRFECGADGDMTFVIEAKRLAIVNSLRGDPDFTLAGDKLTISQGETTTSLPVESPEALAVPEMYLDKDKAFEVDPAKLKRIFTQVAYARDTKDNFYSNYSFGSDGRSLFARATNSKLAARATLGLEAGITAFEATITATAVALIEALEEDSPVKIALGENCLELESASMSAFIHTPERAFPAPQCDSLIDGGDGAAKFAIAKEAMMGSLGIFASSEAKDITFAKEGDTVVLSSDNGISSVRDRIPLESSEGTDFKFALDLGQCRAIFGSLRDAPVMAFRYEDPAKPIRFGDGVAMAGVVTTLV